MIDAGESGADVAQYFQELTKKLSNEDARNLFSKTDANDVLLMWKQTGMVTRFTFHAFASEILFIWRGANVATTTVDDVLTTIARYVAHQQPQMTEAATAIQNLRPGEFVRASTLIQQFNLTEKDSMDLLRLAVSKGQLAMRFRVRTHTALKELANNWRADLTEFPTEVTDEHDQKISLLNPGNIEVGFERL